MVKISLTGFLRDYSGYGEAARRLLLALDAAGADVSPGVILTDGGGQMAPPVIVRKLLEKPSVETPDVSLIVAAPNQFPLVRTPARRTVGYTCWETDRLHPLAIEGCRGLDLVLVPSRQNIDVMMNVPFQAEVLPLPALPTLEVEPFAIEGDPFVFYSILTWQERKNPRGLLIAYLTAFTAKNNTLLLIKTDNVGLVHGHREYTALLKALNLPDPPKVRFIGGRWTDAQLQSLHAVGDCYVTLTRGEACGLPILDAVSRGTRVIVPNWGGHLDFLRALPEGPDKHHDYRNALFVETRMTPVVQAYSYFDGTQCWGDPSLLDAQALMEEAWLGSQHARYPAPDLSSRSLAAVGARLMEVLGGDGPL